MSKRIELLDHGFVELIDSMGNDRRVVDAARASYDADGGDIDVAKDEGLIRYLYKNRHTSPFEHVHFTFMVKAPIFVFRQWMRHRTGNYSEVSARYAEVPEEFYVPDLDKIGVQSNDNKQMRIFTDRQKEQHTAYLRGRMEASGHRVYNLYQELIRGGVPRELARTVLPVAMYSRMYFTMDLHNLLHFLSLRLHEHAQYEIRVYAEAILKMIKEVVPITVKVVEEVQDDTM